MSIRVREAIPGDEATIVRLVQALAEAYGEVSPVTEAYVRGYLASPASGVLLAEEDGQAVGLVSYSVRPDLYHGGPTALIEELVVDGTYRGRSVGSALMAALLRRVAELGCAEVSVTTLLDNEGAQRFYRAHGFVDEALYLERHL